MDEGMRKKERVRDGIHNLIHRSIRSWCCLKTQNNDALNAGFFALDALNATLYPLYP